MLKCKLFWVVWEIYAITVPLKFKKSKDGATETLHKCWDPINITVLILNKTQEQVSMVLMDWGGLALFFFQLLLVLIRLEDHLNYRNLCCLMLYPSWQYYLYFY